VIATLDELDEAGAEEDPDRAEERAGQAVPEAVRIQSRVKKQMEKAQKEYYLNEKMKAIQKELGRKDEKGNELDELKKKIKKRRCRRSVEEKACRS
jgi:ATP-dependent Lon protease